MKKVILAIGVIALMGCFASCKKTCVCTSTVSGFSPTTTETTISSGSCSDLNSSTTTMGVVTKTECVKK